MGCALVATRLVLAFGFAIHVKIYFRVFSPRPATESHGFLINLDVPLVEKARSFTSLEGGPRPEGRGMLIFAQDLVSRNLGMMCLDPGPAPDRTKCVVVAADTQVFGSSLVYEIILSDRAPTGALQDEQKENHMKFQFRDELVYAGFGGGSNRMTPKLYLQTNEEIHQFKGVSIPSVIRILTDRFHKNGKWSYTTWQLQSGEGVRVWRVQGGFLTELQDGKETNPIRFLDFTSWNEVPEDAKKVVRIALPKTSARLDENEKPV